MPNSKMNQDTKLREETTITQSYDDAAASDESPPSYDSDSDLDSIDSVKPAAPASGGLPLPCVIPQITKAFRGAFFSPFVRAYVPELERHGISADEFLSFVDGLNECFIAHPVFQGLGVVGGVMSMFYGIDPVQWAGMGLQFAAGVASASTSYIRTRKYVQAMNGSLFHPAGLHLNVLTTKKMMTKVGYPEDKLKLPPLDYEADAEALAHMKAKDAAEKLVKNSEHDPRLRRVEALKGYVMPLDLNVPAATPPDNLLRRMGANQAAKKARKQEGKLTKRDIKARRRLIKGDRRVEKTEERGERRVEKLEALQAENEESLDRQLSLTEDPKARDRAVKDHDAAQSKLERKISRREAKTERKLSKRTRKRDKRHSDVDKKATKEAHKIRWLVVARWEAADGSKADSYPGSSGDESSEE